MDYEYETESGEDPACSIAGIIVCVIAIGLILFTGCATIASCG